MANAKDFSRGDFDEVPVRRAEDRAAKLALLRARLAWCKAAQRLEGALPPDFGFRVHPLACSFGLPRVDSGGPGPAHPKQVGSL